MPSLLARWKGGDAARSDMTWDEYANLVQQFQFNGYTYQTGLQQTLAGTDTERPSNNFAGLASGAYASNGVVFACMLVRQLVFSSIRFRWQNLRDGKPSDTFGTQELAVLEEPWTGGTTQDLLSRMIQDADLAGNSYWTLQGGELVRLRPDWVEIVGARRYLPSTGRNRNRGTGQVGWIKKGYLYTEGGAASNNDSVAFTVDEVAHFAPIPDPLATFAGMSWLTPILREIQADHAMTRHQRKFFDNGATPNMVVKHDTGADMEKVKRFSEMMAEKHAGVENAYKTLHLYPGADATVVGTNLKDIDFKSVRGGGETRIAAAAGVPPVIVGLSEGLAAATYSNYGQARRRLADGTAHPLWQNVSGSLNRIVPRTDRTKSGAVRLWYDATDVPFLREDEKDAADIAAVKSQTIRQYIDAGYLPDSVVAAVNANDLRLLKHSGLYSVQLQKPGSDDTQPQGEPNGNEDPGA
ncbi:phage portal protein [Nocardia gipuzkoensis]|uniref:phage portal protein n=1 Tax=Nocardia gipuzkoensis TaxID=2749991 RepID=UPI001E36A92F|nr:phage portal protein [Nocardia gipuzkoensis]UGT65319.1 phage portal protein [Nocardia gipuzkoensis]